MFWKLFAFCVFSLIVSTNLAFGQENSTKSTVVPYKIKDSDLSGIDLPKQKLKDHPNREYFQKRLFRGENLSVFILSSETAENEIKKFPIDEFVFYMNGRADIVSDDGKKISFLANDYLVVPKGFRGNWTSNGHHSVRFLKVKPTN